MNTHRTIVVADQHKSIFVCQVLDLQTGEVERRTLASTRDELLPFLTDLGGPVLVFVEACRAWEWVSDLCEELGHDFRLVDPRRMPEIAKSTKKSDRADVEAMVHRLQIVGDLPRSYRPTRRERELRGLTRRLSDLRNQRRKLLVKVHAVIDSQGLPAKKAEFAKPEWRETMQSALSQDTWLDLEILLLSYDQVLEFTCKLEARIKELLAGSAGYERLKELPGVGPVIAATILAESGDIRRFKSARQFAAFTGLVPRVRSSAGKAKYGRITRSGPRDLRWALGQAVMVSQFCKVPGQHTILYRLKRKKKKAPKLAICAGANKLARIVYALLTRDEPYRPVAVAS